MYLYFILLYTGVNHRAHEAKYFEFSEIFSNSTHNTYMFLLYVNRYTEILQGRLPFLIVNSENNLNNGNIVALKAEIALFKDAIINDYKLRHTKIFDEIKQLSIKLHNRAKANNADKLAPYATQKNYDSIKGMFTKDPRGNFMGVIFVTTKLGEVTIYPSIS